MQVSTINPHRPATPVRICSQITSPLLAMEEEINVPFERDRRFRRKTRNFRVLSFFPAVKREEITANGFARVQSLPCECGWGKKEKKERSALFISLKATTLVDCRHKWHV